MQIEPGVYEHFKGKQYRVLGVAKHSETLEDMVVYEALYDNPASRLWARSAAQFLETVRVDGRSVPRFRRVS